MISSELNTRDVAVKRNDNGMPAASAAKETIFPNSKDLLVGRILEGYGEFIRSHDAMLNELFGESFGRNYLRDQVARHAYMAWLGKKSLCVRDYQRLLHGQAAISSITRTLQEMEAEHYILLRPYKNDARSKQVVPCKRLISFYRDNATRLKLMMVRTGKVAITTRTAAKK